jgi:hypothetical protein
MSPMSISTSPSRTREAGWQSTRPPSGGPGHWSNRGCHDSILAHCPGAGRAAVASTSTVVLHQWLGRFQLSVCREFPIPFRQAGATMGPQICQAPERRDPLLISQEILNHEEPHSWSRGGSRYQWLLSWIQRLSLRLSHPPEGTHHLVTTVPGGVHLHHRGRASPRPHWESEAHTSSTQEGMNQQLNKRCDKRPREEVHTVGPPATRTYVAPYGEIRTLDEILDS